MSIVAQILALKGDAIFTVSEDASVLDALEQMAERNTGSVFITDAGDRLIGVFSERDYARKVVLKGKRSATTRVGEVMTTSLKTVHPDTPIHTCMTLMTEERIRHLPVEDNNGRRCGVISIGDVVKAVIREQQTRIEAMETYIQGGPGH